MIFFSRSAWTQIPLLMVSWTFLSINPLYAQEFIPTENAGPIPVEVVKPNVVKPPAIIKIKVMQKGTGQPVRKAEVTAGTNKYLSDPEGNVEVSFGFDVTEIIVVRNGFETVTLPASEYRDTLELDVFLYPRLGADDEVIVKGKRRPSVSKKVISVEEASRVAPGGDPGQVTKLMPGVTTSPGRSEITIRGSAPEDS
ncbi:MAG: hypothetical protein NTV34_11895, partial [Proteobacteria bacterium]|nr:hypothetical protein [Pseudomonadota bacterium]